MNNNIRIPGKKLPTQYRALITNSIVVLFSNIVGENATIQRE